MNDLFGPFIQALQSTGLRHPETKEVQETAQQRIRRLLQAAKTQAIDHYWSLTKTVTAEMRAEARLTIDRELRHEPLDEFTPQEVRELVECIRDRIYTSIQRRQEKETRRTQEADARKRADQLKHDRTQQEHAKKKIAFLTEAQRRARVLFRSRSLTLVQRIHVMDEILTPLDAVFTGGESMSEACVSIDAVLQARMADWEAEDAAKAAKQQEEWMEFAVVVLVIIAGGFTFVKAPGILLWLLDIFFPKPADSPGAPQKPTEQTATPPSDPPTPVPGVKKIRRESHITLRNNAALDGPLTM
jgi:nitrate reductase NapE component